MREQIQREVELKTTNYHKWLHKAKIAMRIAKHAVADHEFVLYKDSFVICPCSLEELHEVRVLLRKALGKWNDKLEGHWFSVKEMHSTYRDKEHPDVIIWLVLCPDEFKKTFNTETCKLVKTKLTEDHYTYQCEVKR